MAKPRDPLARQGYHHGNLKEALVLAARKLIAERGPAGFTLVEAARLAGVSPAAPYRHFKDRTALVAEVARRGFAEFGKRMAEAAAAKGEIGFERMGDVYLAFAREEPGYYAAMFSGGSPRETAGEAGTATFDGLARAISGVAQHLRTEGLGEITNIEGLAYYVWALSHGIATLSAAGFLPQDGPKPSPDELLQSGVAALVRGSLEPAASR